MVWKNVLPWCFPCHFLWTSSKVMVHWPMPEKHVAAYLALEDLVKKGKAKGLGSLIAN